MRCFLVRFVEIIAAMETTTELPLPGSFLDAVSLYPMLSPTFTALGWHGGFKWLCQTFTITGTVYEKRMTSIFIILNSKALTFTVPPPYEYDASTVVLGLRGFGRGADRTGHDVEKSGHPVRTNETRNSDD